MNNEKETALCLKCGNQWKTKFTPKTVPRGFQCPNCWGMANVLLSQYEKDLNELRKQFTPTDAQKFIDLLNYALKHRYVWLNESQETKFTGLLKELTKTSKKETGD